MILEKDQTTKGNASRYLLRMTNTPDPAAPIPCLLTLGSAAAVTGPEAQGAQELSHF